MKQKALRRENKISDEIKGREFHLSKTLKQDQKDSFIQSLNSRFCVTVIPEDVSLFQHVNDLLAQNKPENHVPVQILIVCCSALRSLDIIKFGLLTCTFNICRTLRKELTSSRSLKLFAKHMKIEAQLEMLKKGQYTFGVGTPQRIADLLKISPESFLETRHIVIDPHKDVKDRDIFVIPETLKSLIGLFENLNSLNPRETTDNSRSVSLKI